MEIKDKEIERKVYRNWVKNVILVDNKDYEYFKNI